MRILTIGLFVSFVLAIADPALSPEKEVSYTPEGLDPIVTGVSVDPEHMARWKAESKRYLECPECVASQPFPED